MKIYMNKYRYHWISPYTICEKICFWREIDYDEPWVKRANAILNPVSVALMKVLDTVHPKIDYVKIDYWDTWNMDSTLSPIILPMLKQLKDKKHGAPFTDDEDVPAKLRSTTKAAIKSKENSWDTDCNHFKRWDWIMDEMIWAFEQKCDDNWEDKYYGEWIEDASAPLGGNFKNVDWAGRQAHQARMSNGFRLFGKYYEGLWD
jgi:hypothetical protein